MLVLLSLLLSIIMRVLWKLIPLGVHLVNPAALLLLLLLVQHQLWSCCCCCCVRVRCWAVSWCVLTWCSLRGSVALLLLLLCGSCWLPWAVALKLGRLYTPRNIWGSSSSSSSITLHKSSSHCCCWQLVQLVTYGQQ
jgi:hypothetical protein